MDSTSDSDEIDQDNSSQNWLIRLQKGVSLNTCNGDRIDKGTYSGDGEPSTSTFTSHHPDQEKPHPVYYCKKKQLNPLYNSNIKMPYLKQIFERKETLGRGSFGYVIKALRREDKKQFAIKIIKKGNNGYNERHNEVKIYEKIGKHINIIEYFEAWEEKNELFILMEHCEIDLDTYSSQKHNISEQEVWDILCDMLMALKHLHKCNILHVDIKPENIMISNSGLYKLGDFGIAINIVEFKKLKLTHPLLLSEGDGKYLAPETLQGKFTKLCDVFSLGITLLELSTDIVLPSNGPRWNDLRNDIFPEGLGISNNLFSLLKAMMKSSYLNRPSVGVLLNRKVVKKEFIRRRIHGRINYWLQWKLETNEDESDNDNVGSEHFVVDLNLPLVQCGMSNSTSEQHTPPRNVSKVRLYKSF